MVNFEKTSNKNKWIVPNAAQMTESIHTTVNVAYILHGDKGNDFPSIVIKH